MVFTVISEGFPYPALAAGASEPGPHSGPTPDLTRIYLDSREVPGAGAVLVFPISLGNP